MNTKLFLTVLAMATSTTACANLESTESVGTGGSDLQDPTTTSSSTPTPTIVINPLVLGFCTADRQCEDANDCTTDRCIEHVCKHIPVTYPLACVSAGQHGFCEAQKCLTGCEGQPDGTQCWTEKMILSTCTGGACGP